MVKRLNLITMEWEDIKLSITRTPQILKHKARLGSYTVDEEFEVLHDRLLDITYNAGNLENDIKKYVLCMKTLNETSLNVAKSFEEVFAPSLEALGNMNDSSANRKEDVKMFEDATKSMGTTQKYIEGLTVLEPAITEILDVLIVKSAPYLINLNASLSRIKKFMKKRSNALLDYDACLDSIEKLEIKSGSSTEKTQQSLFALRKREYTLRAEYEKLNSTLKKELPYLFGIMDNIFRGVLFEVYYSQVAVYNIMTVGASTIFKPETGCQLTLDEDSLSRRNQALEKINGLGICSFRDNFLKNLNKFDSTEISELAAASKKRSHGIQRCLALYDFDGTNRGDLSFKKGDYITILEKADSAESKWWSGELNGRVGVFPSNYVEMLPSDKSRS